MVSKILHIGAHRTGTTSLQRFLRDNVDLLRKAGVSTLSPPESRQEKVTDAVRGWLADQMGSPSTKFLISEENILGTMGQNIAQGTLYPNAKTNLKALASVYQPDVVMMSVRELGDYWTSAVLFSVSREAAPFPTPQTVEKICGNSRRWTDVARDICQAFPNARLIVREFTHLQDNPKRFLKIATRWDSWSDTKLNRSAQNARPGADVLITELLERGDFDGLSRMGESKETQIFTEHQRQQMHATYQRDLEDLRTRPGVSLQEGSGPSAPYIATQAAPRPQKTVFLHIGQTGGSVVKALAEAGTDRPDTLFLGNHGDTLVSTLKTFGKSRRLAFFFRDPQERFMSGFNARLRQGRPRYNVNWTTAEAVAFSAFKTPNMLAEALSSKDTYQTSAARFAMASIFHLKYGYAHYLHSATAVRYELAAGNLCLCCTTDRIGANLGVIRRTLGLSTSGMPDGRETAKPDDPKDSLSALAVDNLRSFWAVEYDIFAACEDAAKQLGFTQ